MRRICVAAMLVLCARGAVAQDLDRGEMLYQNHCGACHESTVHVRERSKANTVADIDAFVQRWSDYLKLEWGNDERIAVREYLNLTYYGYFEEGVPPPPSSK